MVMTPANTNKTLLNSDSPLDKIIYITSGNISIPNGTSDNITLLAHSLPFTLLPMLQWSNTADFSITNELRDSEYTSNSFTTGVGQFYNAETDGTNIYLDRYNLSGSTKTLYYRISGFMPSNASADSIVPYTGSSGDNFIINTDKNYMKLAYSGILTTVNNIFNHNFGYVPRVLIWGMAGGRMTKLIAAQEISGGVGTSGVHIDTTKLEWLSPTTYTEIHYRIYYDQ